MGCHGHQIAEQACIAAASEAESTSVSLLTPVVAAIDLCQHLEIWLVHFACR